MTLSVNVLEKPVGSFSVCVSYIIGLVKNVLSGCRGENFVDAVKCAL